MAHTNCTRVFALLIASLSAATVAGCMESAVETASTSGSSNPQTSTGGRQVPDRSIPAVAEPPAQCAPTAFRFPETACVDETAQLELDPCDESDFADATWQTHQSEHFTFHYFSGTAAAADIEAIANKRETAYNTIREKLGIYTAPAIEVYLSPNRVAATEHGRAMGRAYPSAGRYEVVYTGAADSFEMTHYGHELTHVLAHELDPQHPVRLGILSEGLAELLDHSGRDLHAAYADKLRAGKESRAYVASFDSNDAWGSNYGRAGSLVAFLRDRFGWNDFVRIYKRAYVEWSNGCYRDPTYGCVTTGDQVATVLDGILQEVVGQSWTQVQRDWEARVREALAQPSTIATTDYRHIQAVVNQMDAAINERDAAKYRTTMGGFYCEWGGEDMRQQIAARAVNMGDVQTALVDVRRSGTKNFSTAIATVLRRFASGETQAQTLYFEHLPSGWKVVWGPDWQ